jgi:rod shape-determining protein MreD
VAFLRGAGGLLLAWLVLYFQGSIVPEFVPAPDGFLILVVYYAVTRPQIPAMLIGTVAGLTEDSLSAPLGVHAFTKTTLGYVVAGLGSRFLLNQPLPQFLILVVGTPCEALLQRVVLATVGQGFVWPDPVTLVLQALVNGLVGVAVFRIVDRFL